MIACIHIICACVTMYWALPLILIFQVIIRIARTMAMTMIITIFYDMVWTSRSMLMSSRISTVTPLFHVIFWEFYVRTCLWIFTRYFEILSWDFLLGVCVRKVYLTLTIYKLVYFCSLYLCDLSAPWSSVWRLILNVIFESYISAVYQKLMKSFYDNKAW